ncbi:MAG: DUF721 domain-containing protein [Desulfobacterales bacterium]|nr:DUF721 domain-containing protein [Desulfobacterales bacterium]
MAEGKIKRSDFEHIGNILQVLLKGLRHESFEDFKKINKFWPDIVGEMIAQNSKPIAFKEYTLLVYVSSSPWIQNLQFHKWLIIEKINEVLEKELVRDIKFKVGQF